MQTSLFGIIIFLCLNFVSCTGPSNSANGISAYPETCAEAQEIAVEETGSRPSNGTYTLYVKNDKSKPWDAYCHRMSSSHPEEYLTVEEAHNFSTVGIVAPSNTVTHFRRYRIDATKLEIDLLNDTFATTDGSDLDVIPDERLNIPAGWVQFGTGSHDEDEAVTSEINITGTGLAFADSVTDSGYTCITDNGGSSATSSISIAPDLLSLLLTANNSSSEFKTKVVVDCTHLSPDDVTHDYITATLPLQYVGM